MILCFSGVGNSRLVANRLAQVLDDTVVDINVELLSTASLPAGVDTHRVVWTFPVHSWGLPGPVVDAISLLDLPLSSVHFMVATCGDDAGLTDLQWRDLIISRRWRPAGAWTVIMPNTYVCLPGFDVDSSEVAQAKLADMPARVDAIASAISRGSDEVDVMRGAMPRLKSKVVYPCFVKWALDYRKFRVDTERCISCRACERACSLGAVTLDADGHPRWNDACVGCLGCYHHCPVHAISRGRFSASHGRYSIN